MFIALLCLQKKGRVEGGQEFDFSWIKQLESDTWGLSWSQKEAQWWVIELKEQRPKINFQVWHQNSQHESSTCPAVRRGIGLSWASWTCWAAPASSRSPRASAPWGCRACRWPRGWPRRDPTWALSQSWRRSEIEQNLIYLTVLCTNFLLLQHWWFQLYFALGPFENETHRLIP